MTAEFDRLAMAYVPLFGEVLNLAITEHWREVYKLQRHLALAVNYKESRLHALTDGYGEAHSAGVEALAVAVHARLQEQGTLG